ncbi:MAG: CCA tRNA nucleotidyltransferase [Sulfurospirillaceae bacterium]|nr:CCA tRNA nucleotidyltransferase [Sulfurospirillaceae bacterium]
MNLEAISSEYREEINHAITLLRPYTKRAYIVGGSVRDLYLGIGLHDIDIEVYDIEPSAFDTLMQRIGAVGVGKSFFVYKLGKIDFALPRVERKAGFGHTGFDVVLCEDEKEASKRRDFSMNAMMLNIFSGDLLDFWGGLQSLKAQEISLIDEKSFKEDSLRVLRAVQFSARLGFKIEAKTLEVMRLIDLSDLSQTRILWEFEKLFKASFLHYGLYYMYQLALFEKCLNCKVENRFFKVARSLLRCKKNFEEDIYSYYFFYIVANFLGHNPLEWFKALQAPNHYLSFFKYQPFLEGELTDQALLHIALDIPLKNWLGHCKKGVKEHAKALGVWESVFIGGIDVQEVIRDGFTHAAIAKELRRRKMEKIAQWK